MTLFSEIWASFRQLPMPVQVWVNFWLVPVNLISLVFLGQENGVLIAVLAILGMAFNLPIIMKERGMSALMAVPHLLFWTPLVFIALLTTFGDVSGAYRVFLGLLVVTNVASLVMDARDLQHWRLERATV